MRIREGGFGTVYRYEQLLGHEVVVKVLHSRLQRDDAARRRFLREARLASWFDHPYAAHICAFGVEKAGLPWIAMEQLAAAAAALVAWSTPPTARATATAELVALVAGRTRPTVDVLHPRAL